MTLREFLVKLRKHRNKFEWNCGYLGSKLIRGITPDGRVFCPITAVCFAEEEVDYDTSSVDDAANELELQPFTVDRIMGAADNLSGREFYKLRLRITNALDGWSLMAPPVKIKAKNSPLRHMAGAGFMWWFTKGPMGRS